MAVWSPKLGDWPKATIAQYNPSTGQHLLRFLDRAPGEVKHREDWVVLTRTRFQWLTDPPQGARPNPTWERAPRGEDAVHHKVRVFWPGMCRWYTGKVGAGRGMRGSRRVLVVVAACRGAAASPHLLPLHR